MNDALTHRGPDGEGLFVDKKENFILGLGHKRLAIIDLSETGSQPMHREGLSIVFNGEVYNFQEIRKELELLGEHFVSHSDTEVVLAAYQKWGVDCLQHFIGMFAFVIYNHKDQQVFVARDRAGVKPLFWYHHNGLHLFASELKAFHKHPDFQKELNETAVASFIQFGNVPVDQCVFKHTHKLKPGHFLLISLKDQTFIQQRYWNVYDFYNRPKLNLSYADAQNRTEQLLRSAFNYRMVADVPVGVFLSGGYDSACLTALLRDTHTESLQTYTISVPDIGLDEAPFARQLAAHLGTKHQEFACTEKEALDLISTLPYFYDEPFGDSSAIPTTLVAKMARKEVTVALSADGGDEVFAGYNRYDYLMRYHKKLRAMPKIAGKSFAGLMDLIPANKIPILRDKYNFPNRYEKLKQLLKNPGEEEMMLSLSQQYTKNQMNKLMNGIPFLSGENYLSKELQKNFYTPLSYMMAIDYQTYLVDDILTKVDRATMSQSLEGREPYLDHRLIEFAAQLPDEYKYHHGIKKRILKDICHKYIPKELMDRPKMGFAIPISRWLQHELRPLLDHYLNERDIKEQGLFNWEEVKLLKDQFLAGKSELDMKVWYFLMFQMWYEHWMKK